MARPTLTAVYFILTFLAGAAVGSWGLWIYLVGGPADEIPMEPAPPAPAAEKLSPFPPQNPPAAPPPATAPEVAAPAPPTPTPKGHWEVVDIAPRSHEECLALTKQLNDAYKDCRFGVHKQVWVEEQ